MALHLRNTGSLLVSCMSYCTCEDVSREVRTSSCPAQDGGTTSSGIAKSMAGISPTIPTARTVEMPRLPDWIPMLQGNLARPARMTALDDCLALPLTYALKGRGHATRARTRQEAVAELRSSAAPTDGCFPGVQEDPAVERIWPLPDISRIARQLLHAGAIFATSPDFSTILDCPRHDNLHAMKRNRMGLVSHDAGRFVHGAPCQWPHRSRLRSLGRIHPAAARCEGHRVRIPDRHGPPSRAPTSTASALHGPCVQCGRTGPDARGPRQRRGQRVHFARSFKHVVFIDSTAYMRSMKRRRAFVSESGKVAYLPIRTSTTREARALLRHNIHTLRLAAAAPLSPAEPDAQGRLDFNALPAQAHADNETPQLALFPYQEA